MPEDAEKDLNCEIEFIIESNESLAGFIMKNKTEQLLLKYKRMETIFMNTENSITNEPHKFVLNLWQKLDLRSSDEWTGITNQQAEMINST